MITRLSDLTEGCIAGPLIKMYLDEQADKFSVFHSLRESFCYMYSIGELGQLRYFPKLAEVDDGPVVLVRLAGQAQTDSAAVLFETLSKTTLVPSLFFRWAKTEISVTVKEAGVRLPVVGIFLLTVACLSKLSYSTYIQNTFLKASRG